jgi:hypothetical protein
VNGLKEYQRRRLELGDMVRAALHVARGYVDEEAGRQARQLLSRLAEDRFQLAVVGQFSRGKSTLMNAILGGAYLPMGALPMTSVITTVRYGSRPRVLVRRQRGGLPIEAPLAEMARFVAQPSAERSELQVASVDVEVPAEVLRLGFEFVDTPGIGSAIEVNTATTERFLPQADAVIFVTGFDSPLTQAEAGFLAAAGRHAGKLFLVINKRDLVSARGAGEVLDFVGSRLRDDGQPGDPRVFGLSALEALEATLQADGERLSGSGILPLQAALTEFLTAEKSRVFLRNITARAIGLVAGQRRDLRLGRLGRDGGPDPETVAAAFEARIGELGPRQAAVAQTITDRIETGLPGLLAARSPEWQAGLRELLARYAEDALSAEAGEGSARRVLEAGRVRLERAGREIARNWLGKRAGQVQELVTGLVADEIGTLFELCRSPGVLGAGIAGLELAEDRSGLASWSAEDVPALVIPLVEWSVPVPQRSRRRPAAGDAGVRRQLLDALDAGIAGFEGRAREALHRAAGDWADRLRDQAERQAREAADRFRHYLRTVPSDEDLAALDDLAARLASFQAALGTWDPFPGDHAAGGPAEAPGAEPTTGHTGDCVVCEQLETTLTEHLRRDQFLLATREHDQARHARAGGFCPLHTWQYAAMASPVGISAGYARLAGSVADVLDSIDQRSGTTREMAQGVAGLSRQASTCPVCAALAEREDTAIAGVASGPPAGTRVATLCLRHLALALAAGPAPESGRAMLRALAAALRRDAEDMREYALKREALHSGLVTDEESGAYRDALLLLAGQPALARPWG